MGASTFVAELDTQDDPRTETDWRLHQTIHGSLRIKSGSIPREVENQCLKLMGEFGIIFGSFDFIERENGELVFLEVNQMGQFLWLDACRAFPMLSAFCDFVENGTGAFCWSGTVDEDLRYADYAKTAEHDMFLSRDSLHIEPNVTFSYAE